MRKMEEIDKILKRWSGKGSQQKPQALRMRNWGPTVSSQVPVTAASDDIDVIIMASDICFLLFTEHMLCSFPPLDL